MASPLRDAVGFLSIQTTEGTAIDPPAATDAVQFKTLSFDPQFVQIDREVILPQMDTLSPHAVMAEYWQGEIDTEVKTSATAGALPELNGLLECAGFAGTVAAGVSVTYDMRDEPNLVNPTPDRTCTLHKYEVPSGEGHHYQAVDCMFGGLSLRAGFDTPLSLTASYMGEYVRPADSAIPGTITYNTGSPIGSIKSTGTTFEFHSYNPIAREFSLDINLEAQVRGSMKDTSTGGYAWPCYLGRTGPVTGSITFELVEQSEFAFWAALEGSTTATATVVFTTPNGRELTINLRDLVWRAGASIQTAPGQPNMVQAPFSCHHDGTNGAVQFVFT